MTPSRDTLQNHFAVLELRSSASFTEVKHAYAHLKALYSRSGMAISPLADGFSDARRHEILEQIEEAYRRLAAFFLAEGPYSTSTDVPAPVPGIKTFSGQTLHDIRERNGIQLKVMAHETRITAQQLQNIENEKYEMLPPDAYLRLVLRTYATYLGLDANRVISDYLSRLQASRLSRNG